MICPCDSGLSYDHCCGLLHSGAIASQPLQLMRSRFSAFALGDLDYLNRTQRGSLISSLDDSRWTRLKIHGHGDNWVEFTARWEHGGDVGSMSELSYFEQIDGQWVYTRGDSVEHPPLELPARNESCWCASAKKYKRCHG